MLLSFALTALVIWLIVCGIFLGLLPDANEDGDEAIMSEAPSESAQPARVLTLDSPVLHEPEVAMPYLEVPVELLVYRLEREIRMEEAAARNYIDDPSARSLHASSPSTMVH